MQYRQKLKRSGFVHVVYGCPGPITLLTEPPSLRVFSGGLWKVAASRIRPKRHLQTCVHDRTDRDCRKWSTLHYTQASSRELGWKEERLRRVELFRKSDHEIATSLAWWRHWTALMANEFRRQFREGPWERAKKRLGVQATLILSQGRKIKLLVLVITLTHAWISYRVLNDLLNDMFTLHKMCQEKCDYKVCVKMVNCNYHCKMCRHNWWQLIAVCSKPKLCSTLILLITGCDFTLRTCFTT